MILHFGIHTDSLAQQRDMSFGSVTVGPSLMLNVLETQLGLVGGGLSRSQELVAYRGYLEEAQSETERFYSKSFRVDPVGVARTLLDWRSTWYEHGWNGQFNSDVPDRLADMAEVERLAGIELSCGGQRLQRVLTALDEGTTQIEKIVLLNEPDELPSMWRRVVERFPFEVHEGVALSTSADEGHDLGQVQRTLLAAKDSEEGGTPKKTRLAGDGSVVLIRGVSRDISAQALAEYVRKLGDEAEALVIAERDGIVLDNALARVGLPRAGHRHYSRFRAAAQVLKLCLGLVWAPVNPRLLLQFLLHPVGLVHGLVRTRLAEVVANQPGVGGEAWQAALNRALAKLSETASPEYADEAGRAARYWLESPRFSAQEGAPLDILIERAQACADWLTIRLNTADDRKESENYATAFGQARDLIEALNTMSAQGHARLSKVELDRMLDEATYPLANPELFSELGHVEAAQSPETVISPRDHVLWWDIALRSQNPSYPWSALEIEALRANGVELPATETVLRHQARHWLRPVMQARKQLVLVFHDNDKGDHPLVNQIRSLFEGLSEIKVDDCLLSQGAGAVIPALDIPTVELAPRPLPAKRRWWQLDDAARLTPRETESYSSLEKLLSHPHVWLLRYAAKLRQGSAEDLSDGALLYGNLAHRLFERFFNEHADWRSVEPEQAQSWMTGALDALIQTEGALLLQPGQAVQRERVTASIERGMLGLLRNLRSADIVSVTPELSANAPFKDNQLGGRIDLLLTDSQGRDVVLDVKWGGERYRGDALRENRHLQLAAYAYLRRGSQASWPQAAYFIVETGNVLAQDNNVFPDAKTFPSEDGGGIENLWAGVSRTYDWRWEQLSRGQVEVVVDGTEPDPEVIGPEAGFPIDTEADRFDPFTVLTGWEPSQ